MSFWAPFHTFKLAEANSVTHVSPGIITPQSIRAVPVFIASSIVTDHGSVVHSAFDLSSHHFFPGLNSIRALSHRKPTAGQVPTNIPPCTWTFLLFSFFENLERGCTISFTHVQAFLSLVDQRGLPSFDFLRRLCTYLSCVPSCHGSPLQHRP